MIGFWIKDIFQQKLSDIIFVLIIINISSILISFLIKRVHLYLTKYTNMNVEHQTNLMGVEGKPYTVLNEKISDEQILDDTKTISSSDEEFLKVIESLKSLIDVPEKTVLLYPEKSYIKSGTEVQLNNKTVSEAQTIISISPTFHSESASKNLENIKFKSNESCDSFDSINSQMDLEKKQLGLPVVNNELGNCNNLLDYREQFNQDGKMHDAKHKPNPSTDQCHTSQKKILNNAVLEFEEEELNSIKDEIKILKQSLNIPDNKLHVRSSIFSDISIFSDSTVVDSEPFSEMLPLRRICSKYNHVSSNLNKTSCMYQNGIQLNERQSVNTNPKTKENKHYDNNESNVPFELHSKEGELSKQRGATNICLPIPEMYFTLKKGTESSSQSFLNNNCKRINAVACNSGGKSVTCNINLTVSIDSEKTSGMLMERAISPIMSKPYTPSGIHR